MYQFKSWCFLCASEKNVDVEIQTLDDTLRETIGQFSLINFTLQEVPSSICGKCHEFLKDYEKRKDRYARAELMFMELLKLRNKVVDISIIRVKYNIKDDENEVLVSLCQTIIEQPEEQLDWNDVTDSLPIVEPANKNPTSNLAQSSPLKSTTPEARPERRSTKKGQTQATPPGVKLLNPTIHVRIRNVTRLALFKCDLCSHTTSTKASINRHVKQIHLNSNTPANAFKCQVCFKTFARKVILQNHEKIHMTQRPTFDCVHCGKVLSSRTAVTSHIQWIHNERRSFKCSTCSKLFATKESLKVHEKTHSSFKGHICPICSKTFKTASTLVQHIDTHGGTEYHCPDCGLRLNSKRTLAQHMLKHKDVIRHTCEICNAQFKRTKAYKEHLLSQHTGIRAYACDWCPKTFSNGANCRKHKKEAHLKEVTEADKKPLKKIVQLPKIKELLTLSLENSAANKS